MTFPPIDETPTPPVASNSGFPQVPWTWRDLVGGVVGGLLVFFTLAVIIIGVAVAAWGEDSLEDRIARAVVAVLLDVVLVSTVLLVTRRRGGRWYDLGLREPRRDIVSKGSSPPKGLTLLIVIGYFAAIGAVTLYNVCMSLAGLDGLLPSPQLPDDFFDHDAVIAITGIAVIFGAPIAEELFFRGFVFGGLRRYLSFPYAALISGILFSAAHGDPGLVVPFTAVGAILAYTYERSGSLLAPMGVHFIFNTISFSLLLAFPDLR